MLMVAMGTRDSGIHVHNIYFPEHVV
jgi:hypothetical protein